MVTGRLASDDVTIVYDDLEPAGDAAPIVLVHGFAASRTSNWRDQHWYDHLQADGRRVIALDNRGHGESGTPQDSEAYRLETMAGDVIAVLDHLGVERADLLGYSMGGRIGTSLLATHGDRFNAAVLAGVGERAFEGAEREAIAEALLADAVEDVDDAVARRFRRFADSTGNDRRALAACIRGHATAIATDSVTGVTLPILVVAGSADDIAEEPAGLAGAFPNATVEIIEGEDHLSTVPDERFKEAVTAFLSRHGL